MLSVRSLTKKIAGRAVVSGVSFDIADGEVVALLGPSGSGKTSLLRMIAGFDAPSSGSLSMAGREVSSAGRVRVAPEHRQIALAFQDATLFPHLDALANAAFGLREGDAAARRERATQALLDMGLRDMAGRDVATLSGGEAQRVSLARALAAPSHLLLLDEPFGNVDRMTRADLVARLKVRLNGGPAALLITHDPADAVDLGARVLLMHEGRLVADARHDEIAAGACGDWARAFLNAGA